MTDVLLNHLLPGLYAVVALMVLLWLVSIPLRNVSIIDLFWGPAIATCGVAYWLVAPAPVSVRASLAIGLAVLWALRLGIYLSVRNHGQPEDRRYRAMRERNDPGFWFKSIYLVFILQAVLAWLIGLPLYGAVQGQAPLGWLDALGVALFAFGFLWEGVADWQLARFLRQREASGGVMDAGLWRYSRHPNYFGNFCLWWGLWLLAASAGAWWTVLGPLLLTLFLFKVSGVAMLESDIAERRPAYANYIRTTSAFFPRPPRVN